MCKLTLHDAPLQLIVSTAHQPRQQQRWKYIYVRLFVIFCIGPQHSTHETIRCRLQEGTVHSHPNLEQSGVHPRCLANLYCLIDHQVRQELGGTEETRYPALNQFHLLFSKMPLEQCNYIAGAQVRTSAHQKKQQQLSDVVSAVYEGPARNMPSLDGS